MGGFVASVAGTFPPAPGVDPLFRSTLPLIGATAALALLALPGVAPATSGVQAGPLALVAAENDDPGDDPDNNKKGDLALVTKSLPSMAAGQEGWVSLIWTAETDVCDIEVTADGKKIEVAYPTNTGKFSSLYINNALAETNLDYTAFRLTAPDQAGSETIKFEATFTRLKDSSELKKSDDLVVKDVDDCKGSSGKVRAEIDIDITQSSGPAVTLETTSVKLNAKGPTWVSLSFTGNQPGLDGFRVRVEAPRGFEVVYPKDGSSSGLEDGSRLPVEASDRAAVRLDALDSKPGTYDLPVTATWQGGSWSGTVQVVVR